MKKSVNPAVAAVVILSAVVLAGWIIWRLNEDKPIPEGPGSGRIGQTYNLSARQPKKPGGEGKPEAPAGKDAKPGP
jgi:hypothetical protein